ncbi:MAG: GMP synthase [Calditrichaeota bacterium]|nr:GMP synthase [Calditrichota bacterium]
MPKVRVAIIDLYNNEPNQGMRCIKDLIRSCDREFEDVEVTYKVFETRYREEIPRYEDFDIYISSGGPGSPFDGEGKRWEARYFELIERIWSHNQNGPTHGDGRFKHVFFICHSFQMMARFFDFATIQKRRNQSFGILPIVKTDDADRDFLLSPLPETYYVADFRQYEVIEPNYQRLDELGAAILSKEKMRILPELEKALMAVRVSDQFIGTQYHPEADPISMLYHFNQPERKEQVVQEHGEEKYYEMLAHLRDPKNILLTRKLVLPRFLRQTVQSFFPEYATVEE